MVPRNKKPAVQVFADALERFRADPPSPSRRRPPALMAAGPDDDLPVAEIAADAADRCVRYVSVIKSLPGVVRGRVIALAHDSVLPILHVGLAIDGYIGARRLWWRMAPAWIEEVTDGHGDRLILLRSAYVEYSPSLVNMIATWPTRAVARSPRLHLHLHTAGGEEIDALKVGRLVEIDVALAEMYIINDDTRMSMQATFDLGDCWHCVPLGVRVVEE